jgi:hypothetical protein
MMTFTYKQQGDGRDSWGVKEFKDGELVNAFMIYEAPLEFLKKKLSKEFDKRFEIEWKAKGYTDLSDLLSHAANPDSVYHAEALSLIQWSHNEWDAAIADLDESSSIEKIINNLSAFE